MAAKNKPGSFLNKKLKILMVGAEVAPYATVGGFSSVLAYLSRALIKRGHDVRLFMPKFGLVDEKKFGTKVICKELKVPTGDPDLPHLICNVKISTDGTGAPTYFLENQEYYEKRANVYGYKDDPTRWALLSRGVLEFIKIGEFIPDVIHSNDWHTGIVPNFLRDIYKGDPVLGDIPSVFTIHNLRFQGVFDPKHVSELDYDDGKSPVAPFFDPRLNTQNFMRRGILYADAVNTVSKKYSREILTSEFGEGLDRLLLEVKGKLFGIVNGLDYEEFNPEKDNLIERNYSVGTLHDRRTNKRALQNEYDLPVNLDVPLFGFVGRLDWQKGVDLMINTLRHVLKDYDVQFVQVGGGDGGLTQMLYDLKKDFPDKVGIHPYSNFTLPRLLFAGCDCILYPSRFEPCGVVQIEAMRYGAIPIVRKVGGLSDTVENFDSLTKEGNGFVFTEFNEFSLFGQIVRALELFRNKRVWKKLQTNAMHTDFSWEYSAKEYERLYGRAISFRAKAKV
jgi:starch synthase